LEHPKPGRTGVDIAVRDRESLVKEEDTTKEFADYIRFRFGDADSTEAIIDKYFKKYTEVQTKDLAQRISNALAGGDIEKIEPFEPEIEKLKDIRYKGLPVDTLNEQIIKWFNEKNVEEDNIPKWGSERLSPKLKRLINDQGKDKLAFEFIIWYISKIVGKPFTPKPINWKAVDVKQDLDQDVVDAFGDFFDVL